MRRMTMMETSIMNLVEEDTTASFHVKFFDGEQELDKGSVLITPSLSFKSFQSILSRLLQISPHQITIYFQRPSPSTTSTLHHRSNHRSRQPVTSKFDFRSAMSESGSAFFWVVQKRSRRTRRRKLKAPISADTNRNFILLRRDNYNTNYIHNTIDSNAIHGNEAEYYEYMKRVAMVEREREKYLMREREKYLMSMSLNSNVYDDLGFYNNNTNNNGGFGKGYNGSCSDDAASSSSSSAFCEVCFSFNAAFRGEDETVPFHLCKNDVVTKVFCSPAGPIAPPNKKMHSFVG